MLSYCEIILFPIGIYLFKVNIKNTRKQCEINPKLTKSLPKKGHLEDLFNSDIHLPSCEESDFSGRDADSDAELQIFVASKHNCDVKLSDFVINNWFDSSKILHIYIEC